MNTFKQWGICALLLVMAACGNQAEEQKTLPAATTAAPAVSPAATTAAYKKGDPVPSNLVCMVNNAFMGKQQIAVPLEGRTYYGCCEMCRDRIPKDAAVRKAVDPATGKTVDKATAYIVITGDNGEVSYFENENSYKKTAPNQ
ncbi:hypothetical protein [Niabella beijingensis]|uniref:hypothetical protein n=1 Tax=Niabella beijingensis TaxID=2872700 RepID=UPI001CBCA262|nr:hypothetical protein [Niabella beijingensis]MBZ4187539.1 hypothetical protein [Niabella beijingensis]